MFCVKVTFNYREVLEYLTKNKDIRIVMYTEYDHSYTQLYL